MPLVPRGGMHSGGFCLLVRGWAVLHYLMHFSRLAERDRRDGVMRSLEATESDSFTVPLVGLDRG